MRIRDVIKDFILKVLLPIGWVIALYIACGGFRPDFYIGLCVSCLPYGIYLVRKWRLSVTASDSGEALMLWFIIYVCVGAVVGGIGVIVKAVVGVFYIPICIYRIFKIIRQR